jgi:dynein heavy chain
MRIMDCVLLLFQRRLNLYASDKDRPGPKPSWGESLKMMSQTGFLQLLQNFPKDSINCETVELMQPYFSMEDYNMETAKRVCGNVAGLCSWTKAMASFFAVNREVLPLKANLVIQEEKYKAASEELAEANAQLEEKEEEVTVARAIFEEAITKKQTLQDDADSCVRKMKAASALIEGLSGEKTRWTEQSKEFKIKLQR